MNDDRTVLRTHRDSLMRKGLSWVRKARRFQAGINIICVMGGASLSAIGGAMDGGLIPDAQAGLTTKGICVWLGVLLVFVGGTILLLLQDEAPELLARAAAMEAEAEKHLDERDSLFQRLDEFATLDRKRLALIDTNRLMRETLEQALLEPAADMPATSQLMLDAALHLITNSIGFGPDEEWAISIFQVQGDQLVRIAAGRADRLAEKRDARSWERNQGFVGSAWAGARDIIIADGQDPSVNDEYPVPEALIRPYDGKRYRSMAAIPVRVGDPEVIWGVVAASTNCPSRFRRDPGNKQVQAVDTVRAIARMNALMAAAFRRSEQGPLRVE
jgi:hypothetical protein